MLSGEEKIFFYHQLLSISRANLPMTRAASFMDESLSSVNLSEQTNEMTLSLEQGKSLSDFMDGIPGTFSAYERNIVKAGEETGTMAGSLEWLVEWFGRETERARKVRLQNGYLMFSVGIVILTCAILFFLVIPILEEVFTSMGAELPIPTQRVIHMSRFLRDHPFVMAMIIPLYICLRRFSAGVGLIASVIPRIGRIWLFQESVIFASALGRALEAGVRPISAAESAAEFVAHPFMKMRLKTATAHLKNGGSWTDAFRKAGFFPKPFIAFVRQGERHGELDKALSEYAGVGTRLLKNGVDWQLALSWAILPLVYIVVGTLVVAMYLPIFRLAGAVG